ncbi:MAG: ABC transporter ATP-binding protein [Cyanobacteria bacterium K_DeepCast_0m_m1_088]|nr:ABC transporter ATP-binding protein [Cyanobacteria bacterium K_DeepCast_0m_m1_088]
MRSQTLSNIGRLLGYLPQQRLWSLALQLLLSLVPGVVDLLTVAVVARLTGALSGAALHDRLPGIHVFGGDRPDQSLWLIGVFVILAWVSSLTKLLLRYLQNSVATDIWRDLSDQAYQGILRQGYEYHLGRNTSDLAAQILQNYQRVANSAVRPFLQMISALFSIILLTVGVLFIGKWLAVFLVGGMAICYIVITSMVTNPLRHAMRQRLRQERESNEILYESLGSIADVQLTGSERFFLNQFERIGERSKSYTVSSDLLPDLPRGLIEPLGITLIFAVGAIPPLLSGSAQSINNILPFLATIALAALRLTAPLQDLFRGVTMLRGSLPMMSSALDLLDLPQERPTLLSPGVPSAAGVFPRNTIRLQHVHYRYSGQHDWVLCDVSLTIPVGSRVALVGATGSGKTTTANILLGLLHPQQGQLELDGIPVEGLDMPAWQANCAQVPQSIRLLNRTVLENVAFGHSQEQADQERVWQALESAQLMEFVSELPYGLYTQVGENGLRLSGGQRQRLALARAFYRQARFLVLDEATSALDNRTESEVIEALEVIGRRCTTVVIAHRLSTVQRCDRIYEFADGRIKAYGSFRELQQRSDSFRELTRMEDRSASA